MSSLFDYLNEEDNRETLFQRAKRLALSLARRNNRSSRSIQNSQSAGDLSQSIRGWENASDPKVKTAFNDIMNILKNKSKQNGKDSDTENSNQNDENDQNNNQDNQNNDQSDSNQDNQNDIENLDPQSAQNVEIAREQEKRDIEKYSKQIIDNEKKKLETAKSIAGFIENLLKLIVPDNSKISADFTSKEKEVQNKVDMVNNITDTITSIKDQYDSMEKDYKTKVEAQDKWLKDKELEINNKNAPEIDQRLRQEKQAIDNEIFSEIRNANLTNEYNDYKNLMSNIQYLNDEQRQRLESYQNGRIGQIINNANQHNRQLSQSDIDSINRQFRETELAKVREKAKRNKKNLKNKYEFEMKNFDTATKDTMKYLEKYKDTLEKDGKFSEKDNEKLTNSLKNCNDDMRKIVDEYSKYEVNNSDDSEDNSNNNSSRRNR